MTYADRLRHMAGRHDSDAEDEDRELAILSKAAEREDEPSRRVCLFALMAEAKANADHHRERAFVLRGMAEEVERR